MSDSPLNLSNMRLYFIGVVVCRLAFYAESCMLFAPTKLRIFFGTVVKKMQNSILGG
jgi:hypothetical protein